MTLEPRFEQEITQVALNYIEGWYEGDPEKMVQALHPKLVKRRFLPSGEIWDVDTPWMVEATKEGRGKIDSPAQGRKEVSILDLYPVKDPRVATVKILSEKFVDYLHLVHANGIWQIVAVTWDFLE